MAKKPKLVAAGLSAPGYGKRPRIVDAGLARGLSRKQRTKLLKRQLKHTAKTTLQGGDPGVPSPTIDPFMTSEDMMNNADAQSKHDAGLADQDYELEQLRIATEQGKFDINAAHTRGVAGAEDDLANRGLTRSGIRDSSLWDLDATAALGRQNLDTKFNAATLAGERQKSIAETAWTSFQNSMNQKQVENANQIRADVGPYTTDPVAPTQQANPLYTKIQQQMQKLQHTNQAKKNNHQQAAAIVGAGIMGQKVPVKGVPAVRGNNNNQQKKRK